MDVSFFGDALRHSFVALSASAINDRTQLHQLLLPLGNRRFDASEALPGCIEFTLICFGKAKMTSTQHTEGSRHLLFLFSWFRTHVVMPTHTHTHTHRQTDTHTHTQAIGTNRFQLLHSSACQRIAACRLGSGCRNLQHTEWTW